MKKHLFTLLFLVLSIVAQAQKVEYLVKPTLELDAVSPFNEGISKVSNNGRNGFIDSKGKVIIPLKYSHAYLYNGFVIANSKDGWNFMDKRGRQIDTTKIKIRKDVTKGFAYIDKSKKINFIDSTDYSLKPWNWANEIDFIYQPDYYANLLDPMPDIPIYDTWKQKYKGNFDVMKELPDVGLTLAKNNNNKYGLVDKTSSIILPFEYDRIILPFDYEKITPFDDGYAYVEKNNKVGTIDKYGKIVIPVKYDNITFYHHKKRGLIKVNQGTKYGLIDKIGNVILPVEYDDIKWQEDSCLIVLKNNKFGLVDKNGKIATPIRYDYIENKGEHIKIDNNIRVVKIGNKSGCINNVGELIFPLKFDKIEHFYDGFASACDSIGCGLIDTKGNIVIPLEYQYVEHPTNGLIRQKKNGKYGFLDISNRVVIPFQHEVADSFSEDLAGVKQNNKWGFINRKGDLTIPYQFQGVDRFYGGKAKVRQNALWGYIDKSGRIIVPMKYRDISYFHNGYAQISYFEEHGFVDSTGREVVPLKRYDSIESNETYLGFQENSEWKYLNKSSGKFVQKFDYASRCFFDGMAWIRNENANLMGAINKKGETIIPLKYHSVTNFIEGLAFASNGDTVDIINKTGSIIFSFRRHYYQHFSEGLAVIGTTEGNFIFVDRTGKITLKLPYSKFDDVMSFSEGLSWVEKNKKWGCINKKGEMVIPFEFDDTCKYFSEGLAWVKLNGKWGIIKNPLAKK